jgi:hypothetical protein
MLFLVCEIRKSLTKKVSLNFVQEDGCQTQIFEKVMALVALPPADDNGCNSIAVEVL